MNETHRSILIRNRKAPQEKLGNNQTVPLLGESFSIIKLQAQADEWIFHYHGGNVRARFEWLCVLAGIAVKALAACLKGDEIQEVVLVSGQMEEFGVVYAVAGGGFASRKI